MGELGGWWNGVYVKVGPLCDGVVSIVYLFEV